MAQFTVGGEAGRCVVRVGSTIVVSHVATGAGIRRTVIITGMTGIAINGGMGACEGPIVVMNRECGRRPARIGGMACFTVGADTDGIMVRICGLVVIRNVATGTGIGCVVIITCMTGITINAGMGACEGIVVVMDWKCSRLPARICGMAGFTIVWNA